MTRVLAALVVAGCVSSSPAPAPLANTAKPPERATTFTLAESGLGPINGAAEATRDWLRASFPGLRLVTRDLGEESGIVHELWDGREQLFYVVPDDELGWTDDSGHERRYAKTLFAIFVVSPRIAVADRPWRVGETFAELYGLERCECWGDRQVTACVKQGAHIQLVFEDECTRAETDGPSAMIGKRIARIMWKARTDFDPREVEAVP